MNCAFRSVPNRFATIVVCAGYVAHGSTKASVDMAATDEPRTGFGTRSNIGLMLDEPRRVAYTRIHHPLGGAHHSTEAGFAPHRLEHT